MPSKPENLEWIDVADFTPGVVSSSTSGVVPGDAGAAKDAWMCVPGPSGGLIPGPRLMTAPAFAALDNLSAPDRDTYTGGRGFVLDFKMFGVPIYTGVPYDESEDGFEPVFPDDDPQEKHFGPSLHRTSPGVVASGAMYRPPEEFAFITQHYDLGSPQARITKIHMKSIRWNYVFPFDIAVVDESVVSDAVNAPALGADSAPYVVTDTQNVTENLDFDETWRYYGPANLQMSFHLGGTSSVTPQLSMLAVASVRGQTADRPTIFDGVPPNKMWIWSSSGTAGEGWELITVKTSSNAWVTSPWMVYSGATSQDRKLRDYANPVMVTFHQGRGVIAATPTTGGIGMGAQLGGNDNNRYWADLSQGLRFSTGGGSHDTDQWTGFISVFEPIGGIAAMGSLSSDHLFLLGHNGGGVSMRGDLATDPVLTRLPMLPSARGRATHIIPTPVGLVWGTRDGVWLWSGGESAELLSPNLDPDFWWSDHYDVLSYNQLKGRPACAYPLLFFPNGWMCDLRFRSWFRFGINDIDDVDRSTDEDTYPYPMHYDIGVRGHLWSCQPFLPLDGDSAARMLVQYDLNSGSSKWHWTSHTFAATRNRVVSFREVSLTVYAPTDCDLYLRVFGLTADGSPGEWAKTVSVTGADRVQVLRMEMAVDLQEAQFTVEADAGASTGPTLHRFGLGYQTERSVQRY